MCPNCEKNDVQHSEVVAVMRERLQQQSAKIKAMKYRLASKTYRDKRQTQLAQ